MPTDSHTLARQKEFKFMVEFDGFTSFLVSDFDPGDQDVGVTKHAGAGQNHPSKEAGFLDYDPAVIRFVVPLEGEDAVFWENWMKDLQDPKTGNGKLPKQYRRSFTVHELGPTGAAVKRTEFHRAFPVRLKKGSRNSMNKDRDAIEEVHVEYEWREPRQV